MAFAGTPSTTGATILGSTVTSLYQRTMLDWMRPTWRFYSFANKVPVPPRAGASVVWNRKVALATGFVLSQGVPLSAVKTLSTNQVSALVQQLGDAINVSDYARLTSSVDTDAYALEQMADQSAHTVEQYILEELASNTVITHFVKKAGGVAEGGRATVVSAASATRLAMSDVRIAATRLKKLNVPPYDGGSYVMIAHPNQTGDLMSDTNFQGWVAYQNPEAMYNGELGKIFNVRVVESTYTPIAPGSAYSGDSVSTATGSAIVAYGAVMFGRDAYGVTELDGGISTFKSTGASKSDPNNLIDVYSWKANIAAKVLNPSALMFIWSSQDEVFRPGGIGGGTVLSDLRDNGTVSVLFPSATTYYPSFLVSW